jgi:hypothetical protein
MWLAGHQTGAADPKRTSRMVQFDRYFSADRLRKTIIVAKKKTLPSMMTDSNRFPDKFASIQQAWLLLTHSPTARTPNDLTERCPLLKAEM